MKTTYLIPFLFMLMAFDACSPSESKESPVAEEEIVVKTRPVTSESIAVPIVVSGAVASKKEAKLSFKTGGIIARLYADEGQLVRKGQLLASLNLTEISAQASQARNNQEKAQRDMERAKRLYADSAATYEQLQNATTGFEVAQSGLRIAQFNLQYSQIYAPDNGRILKRYVEEGEIIGSGKDVFTIAAFGESHWIVRVGVADRDMVRLKTGDKAQVTLDAHPGTDFTATITEIAQTADPRTGTFEVELRIDPKGRMLASGMIAKMKILPTNGPSMLVVPIEALVEADGERGYVYILNADHRSVKKLPIRVALMYNNAVAISEGLKSTDTVITDGVSYLTADARVKVIK
jgi:multidrug efflux system membrane fusion protein